MKTWSTTSVALALVAVSLVGCSSAASTKAASAGSAVTLNLGGIAPQTGAIAQYGQDFTKGFNLAVKQANAAGLKVKGGKLTVKADLCDSQNTSNQAVTCGKQLQSHGDPVIVASTSTEGIPLLPFNTSPDGKFVDIALSGSPDLTTQKNPLAARYFQNAPDYMTDWTKLLQKLSNQDNLGVKNVAIMDTDSEFGQAWTDAFTKAWKALGYKSESAKYESGATDVSPQLTKLMTSKPQVIAVLEACAPDAQIIKQARQLGFKGTFIVQFSCAPTDLAALVNPSQWAGSFFEAGRVDTNVPDVQAFKAAYKKVYNTDADSAAAGGYSSASWAIYSAVTAGNVTDATAIRAAMPKTLTATAKWNVAGYADMQPNGDVSGGPHIAYVKSMSNIVQFTG